MLTVLAYHPGDQSQALRLADWMAELGGCKNHELLLIRDTRVTQIDGLMIRQAFEKSFRKVTTLDYLDVYTGRSWSAGGSAFAANDMFATAAKHIYANQNSPWLWLEPDVVPLCPNWNDEIEKEYLKAIQNQRVFLGDLVTPERHRLDVVTHMSGIGVYPPDCYKHFGLALIAGDMAWDVAASSQIVPQMMTSDLILHLWKHPPFESWQDVQRDIFDKKPKCALFHADKAGSLIPLLRERMVNQNGKEEKRPETASMLTQNFLRSTSPTNPGGDTGTMAATVEEGTAPKPVQVNAGPNVRGINSGNHKLGVTAGETALTCDIFIKSYPIDYPWLEYCLRSILQNTSNFDELRVVIPTGGPAHPAKPRNLRGRFLEAVEYGNNGYLSQQVFKLYADYYTQADYICYLDSDTILTKLVTPDMFFTNGKVNWLMTPHVEIDTPWRACAEKFLKRLVEFEFMRRFPIVAPRWLLAACREFCQAMHDMPLSEYVMAQNNDAPFSEFNVLGAFAYYFHREKFNWINTSTTPESEWPPLVVLQKFSHGGLSDEIRAEFETILSGSTEKHSALCLDVGHEGGDATVLSIRDPKVGEIFTINANSTITRIPAVEAAWKNRSESVDEIKRLASRLSEFQVNARKTYYVRQLLHEAGVIQLPYRYKKRKGWKKKKAKL